MCRLSWVKTRVSTSLFIFSLLSLSCFSSPPWAANQEPHQLGTTNWPLPGSLPQSPRPGMALQRAGLSLTVARGPRPWVCSRTSCGGSLWKPKREASGAGECRPRPPAPGGPPTPPPAKRVQKDQRGGNMEVGCGRGKPRPRLWLQQREESRPAFPTDSGEHRHRQGSGPISRHTANSSSGRKLAAGSPGTAWGGMPAWGWVGVGGGSLLRAFIQLRMPGKPSRVAQVPRGSRTPREAGQAPQVRPL